MKRILLLFLSFLTFQQIVAQENLIKNPNFDNRWLCPRSLNNVDTIIQHWFYPLAPSDRVALADADSCSNPNWYLDYFNSVGFNTVARSGTTAPRFLTFGYWRGGVSNYPDMRTYLSSKLKQPLVKNETYYFEMHIKRLEWAALASWGTFATNGQAVNFSENLPRRETTNGFQSGPIAPSGVLLQNRDIVWKDTTWQRFSMCFQANGKEQYATIGCFLDPNNINRVIIRPSAHSGGEEAYHGEYAVDDVKLISLKIPMPTDTTICEGDTLTIDATRNVPVTYVWEDGSVSPIRKFTKTGDYKLYANYSSNQLGCKIEQAVKVTVIPKNVNVRRFDTLACDGKIVALKAGYGSPKETYIWQDNSINRTFSTRKEGIYWVKIRNECSNFTDSFRLKYENCQISIFAPNAFSPNWDNNNDVFKPFVNQSSSVEITDYQFQIFDRWGEKIFTTTNLQNGWDGKFNGQEPIIGVYAWQMLITARIGNETVERVFSGDVSLLK